MRILGGVLLLTACAPVERGGAEDELARTLAGRVPGAAERCVPTTFGEPIRIAGPGTLTYRRGETIWVNRQDRDCFGAGALDTLVIEQSGGSYCSGDRVRRLEPGSSVPGPTCLLRDWVPYRRAS